MNDNPVIAVQIPRESKKKLQDTNIGYFSIAKDGSLCLNGFFGINDTVKFDMYVVEEDDCLVIEPNPHLAMNDSIIFSAANLRNKYFIQYLRDQDAIGVLFVKVLGKWVQCKGVRIIEDDAILQQPIKNEPGQKSLLS